MNHRHLLDLLEIARGLMFQSRLPMCCWGEYILTATHILNRLPSRVFQGKTPYEVLFQHKPKYDYFRNFGCLCYASTLAQGKGKFDERATACVLLGYPIHQKGYKLLELSTRKVFVSRDVRFHESHFPFTEINIAHHPIFPTSIFNSEPTSPLTSPAQTQLACTNHEIADDFLTQPSTPSSYSPTPHTASPRQTSTEVEPSHNNIPTFIPHDPIPLRRS